MGRNSKTMALNKQSLVAYFDILGYQSFLKNNADSEIESAEKVFKLVKSAPKEAVGFWLDVPPESNLGKWKPVIESIQSLVFSDTIVISCPVPESGPEAIHFMLLVGVAAHITVKMFKNGLPVRGAITLGSFIFDDTCIAGRAVVDAYNLCQTLNVSGTALSPDLSKLIDEKCANDKELIWDRNYPYYLFPLTDSKELKTRAVFCALPEKGSNIDSEVREAFWKWSKDIPLSVDVKVSNTAKMLDFYQMHRRNIKIKEPEKT
jgi:hypothetical protein